MAAQQRTLAEVVQHYRWQRGISQAQLARYTGLSKSFISQLEGGRYKTAEPPTLQKLADVLEAPLSELLEAAGITEAPYRPIPETLLPPPTQSLPPDLARDLAQLLPEDRARVEEYIRALQALRAKQQRRRSKRDRDTDPDADKQDLEQPGRASD